MSALQGPLRAVPNVSAGEPLTVPGRSQPFSGSLAATDPAGGGVDIRSEGVAGRSRMPPCLHPLRHRVGVCGRGGSTIRLRRPVGCLRRRLECSKLR